MDAVDIGAHPPVITVDGVFEPDRGDKYGLLRIDSGVTTVEAAFDIDQLDNLIAALTTLREEMMEDE